MKFKYKIQNKNGVIVEATEEANDRLTLSRKLRDEGNMPLSIEELKESNNPLKMNFSFFNSVSLEDKIIFTRNLSGMLSAGLSITRALQVLEKQSTNVAFTKILTSLLNDISSGNSLSDGMRKFPKVFSGIFISMVRSGEESGSLPQVLSEVGITLRKTYDLNKKVKSAMMYPSIIMGAILLIGVLMMIFVVPTLTKTFKDIGVALPKSTQFIIWLSDTLSEHTILFFLIVGIIIFGFVTLTKLKSTKRYIDYVVIRLPVVGTMMRELNTARTARTMSSLLSAGVDVSRALSITSEVLQNVYYKELIQSCIVSLEKGQPLSVRLKENTKLYPVMMGEMVEVGEETGNVAKMLLDIANFYESEIDNKTKDLSTIIEPVLMVFIGGAVGFFAVSMISPMYSVMDNIK